MNNINRKKALLGIIFSVFLFFPVFVSAQQGILPAENYDSGNYTLNDAMQLGVNVSQLILGIVGSLALLMFIIGGLMFLVSGGNSQTVETGKKILIGAVIGLAIVFASYLIIQFSMQAMGLNWRGTTNVPTSL
jgi:hypothetical protein